MHAVGFSDESSVDGLAELGLELSGQSRGRIDARRRVMVSDKHFSFGWSGFLLDRSTICYCLERLDRSLPPKFFWIGFFRRPDLLFLQPDRHVSHRVCRSCCSSFVLVVSISCRAV